MKQTGGSEGTPETRIFRDPAILTDGFIPENLQYREKQIGDINYNLASLVTYGYPLNNILLYGPPGTGKTHSIKRVLSGMESKVTTLYSPAYRGTSAHGFFRRFLEKNFNMKLHPRESISVYYSRLEARLAKLNSVLIVFDDIQHLLSGDPKGLDGLLFYLSRLGENVGLILIGNIRVNDLSDALDAPTISTLRLRSVYFPKYNSKELKDILMERAEKALTEEVFKKSVGSIAKIAAITGQAWGSARYGLDLLREAGMVSEAILKKDYIPEEAVDQADEQLEVSKIQEEISNLPPHALAVLEAVQGSSRKGEKELSTGDVYQFYEKICGLRNLNPFSLRKISDVITDLDLLGLIHCRQVYKGRYGRTRIISWPKNPILDRIFDRIMADS